MSVEAVCTMCGKTFTAIARVERALCGDCQAAMVRERPDSPIKPAFTEFQDDRLNAIYPPELDREPSAREMTDPNASNFSGTFLVVVLGGLAGAALALLLFYGCGKF